MEPLTLALQARHAVASVAQFSTKAHAAVKQYWSGIMYISGRILSEVIGH